MEHELRELDRQIREARRAGALAGSLQEKLESQKAIKALESSRSAKRRALFEAHDAIDAQRDTLIERTEQQLRQRHSLAPLFVVRWRL